MMAPYTTNLDIRMLYFLALEQNKKPYLSRELHIMHGSFEMTYQKEQIYWDNLLKAFLPYVNNHSAGVFPS